MDLIKNSKSIILSYLPKLGTTILIIVLTYIIAKIIKEIITNYKINDNISEKSHSNQ